MSETQQPLRVPESVPTVALQDSLDALLSQQQNGDEAMAAFFLEQRNSAGEAKFSQTTFSNYQKEFRRLLLFCQINNVKFATLQIEQVYDFINWLKSPPQELISNAKRPFGDPKWRPFSKGLSASSLHQVIAACKSLFTFLQNMGKLSHNPFATIDTNTSQRKIQEASRKNRALLLEDIKAVLSYINTAESTLRPKIETHTLCRQRWLFYAYLFSGVRLSDLLQHDTNALQLQTAARGKIPYWLLHLVGKGGKPATIPVSDAFISEFKRYRQHLQKPALPNRLHPEPFFFDLKGKQALTSRQSLHNVFKALIWEVADKRETDGDIEQATRLRHSSVHWLRHSFVTIGLDVSSDIPAIAELARHSDIKTTMSYDKSQYTHLTQIVNDIANLVQSPIQPNATDKAPTTGQLRFIE